MTAARDRPAATWRKVRWDECSLLPDRAGVPWWGAVSLALGLTAVGVLADIQRLDRLGTVFQACYFFGCLLAVSLVARKGLFGPMVQPPLILATAVPGVVLFAGSLPPEAGMAGTVLAIGTPLINGFPTMAATTGMTFALGTFRMLTQRPPRVLTRDDGQPSPAEPDHGGPDQTDPGSRSSNYGRYGSPDYDDEAITGPITRQPSW